MDYIFVKLYSVVDLPKGDVFSGNDLYAKVKCGNRVKITNIVKNVNEDNYQWDDECFIFRNDYRGKTYDLESNKMVDMGRGLVDGRGGQRGAVGAVGSCPLPLIQISLFDNDGLKDDLLVSDSFEIPDDGIKLYHGEKITAYIGNIRILSKKRLNLFLTSITEQMDFFRKQTLDVVFTQKKRLFGLGDDEEESEDE
tara:strand:- start:715 stop:1302 length:588 start_codon:yes stop_codon:yes gene_type:complete